MRVAFFFVCIVLVACQTTEEGVVSSETHPASEIFVGEYTVEGTQSNSAKQVFGKRIVIRRLTDRTIAQSLLHREADIDHAMDDALVIELYTADNPVRRYLFGINSGHVFDLIHFNLDAIRNIYMSMRSKVSDRTLNQSKRARSYLRETPETVDEGGFRESWTWKKSRSTLEVSRRIHALGAPWTDAFPPQAHERIGLVSSVFRLVTKTARRETSYSQPH